MNGGNVLLSGTQDRLFILLYLSPPSWVSLVFPPACLSCVLLSACLPVSYMSALLFLSFSVAFLELCCVFLLSFFWYLFFIASCCFVLLLFSCHACVFSRVPFAFFHVTDPFPACPRSASMHREWHDLPPSSRPPVACRSPRAP